LRRLGRRTRSVARKALRARFATVCVCEECMRPRSYAGATLAWQISLGSASTTRYAWSMDIVSADLVVG